MKKQGSIMDKMSYYATWVVVSIIGLSILGAVIYLSTSFSTAVVTLQVERASPTVLCAKIVTAKAAALDCWKE